MTDNEKTYLGRKTLNLHTNYCWPTNAVTRTTVSFETTVKQIVRFNWISQSDHGIWNKYHFNIP